MKSISSRTSSSNRSRKKPTRRTPTRRTEVLRFDEARGKTVEFVEVDMNFDFPCVEIGFQDKTALHFVLGIAGFIAEPEYSVWKDGNQRVLKQWPEIRSDR